MEVLYDERGLPVLRDSHGEPIVYYDPMNRPYKPHRQGRSAATRARKKLERELVVLSRPTMDWYGWRPCTQCHRADYFVDDQRTGELICGNCGTVLMSRMVAADELALIPVELDLNCRSRGYQRTVHYAVRMRQALCKDPVLNPKLLKKLYLWIQKTGWREVERRLGGVPAERWGPRCFRQLLAWSEVDQHQEWGGKRIAQHWIQIRMNFRLDPWQVRLDPLVLWNMWRRYEQVAKVFEREKLLPESLHFGRRNIYTLNYIIAQLLRLEATQDDFEEYGCFWPHSPSPRQPRENNEKWRDLMLKCQAQASWVVNDAQFDHWSWPYIPISDEETEHIFHFFV